ncbi:MAG TPA: ATP-binding cassette domain-containing protein [Verrucomicrobiota bacterium]|nr:ATP-binding cassette domain-containing protein [Verrucomicrobiota bacterium]
MPEPVIRFADVKKAFGPKVIYKHLDLEVFQGETLTIMGGSGVGKSVLLKLLIRLLPTDAGSITFHDEEITTMSERRVRDVRRRIAMLFQGAALFDSISVGENVAYGLEEHYNHTMSPAAIAERVDWALSLVGLPGIESMRPSDLSGGMKKRVGLARAVALKPEVLLYDEPIRIGVRECCSDRDAHDRQIQQKITSDPSQERAQYSASFRGVSFYGHKLFVC